MEYSASMVSTLFWFNETRKTAELLINGRSKDEIKEIVVRENTYQIRAEDRMKRIYGVAMKRLESIPQSLVAQLIMSDISSAKVIVLISILKTDRLFFEFVHEVYRNAIILGENKITDRAINKFFDNKINQSEVVAAFSESAIKKLKQCCVKMLYEAGVLKMVSGERKINIPAVDYNLKTLLEENNLGTYLNVITGEG